MTAVRSTTSGAGTPRELTAPVEDYLKVIYEIESAGEPDDASAGTNEIAETLGIAPASVSGMVRRLAEQGLITHERYRGVRLTEQGRRAALRTIRRHRVIESYLAKALGYPWDRVHDEAERLEHACSDELIDRMASAIGEPTTDPHGHPIPARDGTLAEQHLQQLATVQSGVRVKIERVSDRDGDRLRYLAELGVTPGTVVEVVRREPFEGPITLRIGRVERVIGPALAAHVLVSLAAGSTEHRRKPR
jgi:DtxR family Mn-dependent transcriptional regulator